MGRSKDSDSDHIFVQNMCSFQKKSCCDMSQQGLPCSAIVRPPAGHRCLFEIMCLLNDLCLQGNLKPLVV